MPRYLLHCIYILFLSMPLYACVSGTNQVHTTCRMLKSDLVFSGATSNVRDKEIDSAERPLQQNNYDTHCP